MLQEVIDEFISIIFSDSFSFSQILESIRNSTLQKTNDYIKDFKKKMHYQSFYYGNIRYDDALELFA